MAVAGLIEQLLTQLDEVESTQFVAACFEGADGEPMVVSRGIDPHQDADRLWLSFGDLNREGELPELSLGRAFECQVPLSQGRGFVLFCSEGPESMRAEMLELLIRQLSYAVGVALERCTLQLELERSKAESAHLQRLAVIGRSTADIVHELNNPLGSIVAYSDRLAMTFQTCAEHQSDYERVQKIQRAARRIHQFSRNINNFGRPQIRQEMALCPTEIVAKALELCEYQAHARAVGVKHIPSDSALRIVGAEQPLVQVFVNLFENAYQAMAESGGQLLVEERRCGDSIQIRVVDQGCGLSDKQIERVFEPYFSTKSAAAGLGLGLSIVKRIVEEHAGTIGASKHEHGGMIFQVDLPLLSSSYAG
jgi:two-component system, NtrC family, sensor kinase